VLMQNSPKASKLLASRASPVQCDFCIVCMRQPPPGIAAKRAAARIKSAPASSDAAKIKEEAALDFTQADESDEVVHLHLALRVDDKAESRQWQRHTGPAFRRLPKSTLRLAGQFGDPDASFQSSPLHEQGQAADQKAPEEPMPLFPGTRKWNEFLCRFRNGTVRRP